MSSLLNKVAFVTGGGSGIGRGIALRLAREGADICVPDVDEAGARETVDLVTQLGRRAMTVKANVASQVQIQQAAKACVAQFGRLDFAVANAGIGRGGSVLEMSLKDWQDQVDVNLTGVFLTVQAAAREMVALGHGGRIVCISSLAALNTSSTMWAYSATKVGVRMMVRGWAQDLGQYGITVNAIGPGVIETPLAAGLAGEPGGNIRGSLESRTPVGRVGRPDDIAGLVNFLVGPDGSFMSGSYLVMDGGLRDARGGWEPDAKAAEELARIQARSLERHVRMQAWLDDRD
ncbi:MAG: SDR family oxidoreductase [Pseudomonadales bacterium]|nr:SDR family oxidoreductase [Pseudomonadales bacterium]MCP5185918.1 SDR family oxidoreductase [Pseudomonadales bacterium]